MFKYLQHIWFFKKTLLIVLAFIFFNVNGFSQDDYSDSSVYTDTVIAEDTEYKDIDEETPEFDSLSLFNIPSFNTYEIHDSVLENLRKDEAFWYVDKAPKSQKPVQVDSNTKYSEPFYLKNWFRAVLWILIIGAFIAVLVWFLIASDIKLFRRKAIVLQLPEEIAISEDIFSINYENEMEKAAASQNYRLGVRLMYLHILKLLAEKNIIQYKVEKTNSDYLFQLANTSYYKDFFRLTRNFEYVWYGKFDISQAAFEMIRQDHTKIKSQL